MDHGRILIAEDNATIAKILRFTLRKHGYEVEVAANGIEAWDRVQNEQFDLIITDHRMPKMTGIEFCLRLRAFD